MAPTLGRAQRPRERTELRSPQLFRRELRSNLPCCRHLPTSITTQPPSPCLHAALSCANLRSSAAPHHRYAGPVSCNVRCRPAPHACNNPAHHHLHLPGKTRNNQTNQRYKRQCPNSKNKRTRRQQQQLKLKLKQRKKRRMSWAKDRQATRRRVGKKASRHRC